MLGFFQLVDFRDSGAQFFLVEGDRPSDPTHLMDVALGTMINHCFHAVWVQLKHYFYKPGRPDYIRQDHEVVVAWINLKVIPE